MTVSPQKHRRAAAIATALASAAVLIVAFAVVAAKARHEPAGEDYWSVAVPGLLTGFGTLVLAGVTVWLSLSERRRDDRLRDDQRRQLEDQASARLEAEGLREARKVMTNIVAAYPFQGEVWRDVVQVINASSEPILDLKIIGGEWPEELRAAHGGAEYLETRWQTGRGEASRSHVMAGQTQTLNGRWMRRIPDSETDADGPSFQQVFLSNAERGTLAVSIAWTDSSGRYWRRDGRHLPERLPRAWVWADAAGW